MLPEEGLTSKNLSVIKEARAVSMKMVLKSAHLLNTTISQDEEGESILEEIDYGKKYLAYSHLLTSYTRTFMQTTCFKDTLRITKTTVVISQSMRKYTAILLGEDTPSTKNLSGKCRKQLKIRWS